jgi:hypothetical protein
MIIAIQIDADIKIAIDALDRSGQSRVLAIVEEVLEDAGYWYHYQLSDFGIFENDFNQREDADSETNCAAGCLILAQIQRYLERVLLD